MMYDTDYAIYQYINAQVEQYVEFDDLLKQNHCTMEEAQQEIKAFREKYHSLLAGYAFSDCDLAAACEELMAQMEQHPGSLDLQYLYLCIVTDFGLLWNAGVQERSAEQEVRNYFRQRERMQELTAFLQVQAESMRKYENLLEHLKKPIEGNQAEYAEESDFLYHLTIQHIFLHDGIKNEIYRENMKALLIHVNSDAQVRSLKPYVIFAVLARKTGMMQKRKHFMPNLNAVLQYQDYQILKDNGKNFNRYQSELELYDHLRRAYAEDADMDFCDFCFANLSPLSEWYYLYCEPNEDIPMTIGRKIQTQMPLSFPNLLSDEAYETLDEDEIQACQDAAETLKEKMLSAAAYL